MLSPPAATGCYRPATDLLRACYGPATDACCSSACPVPPLRPRWARRAPPKKSARGAGAHVVENRARQISPQHLVVSRATANWFSGSFLSYITGTVEKRRCPTHTSMLRDPSVLPGRAPCPPLPSPRHPEDIQRAQSQFRRENCETGEARKHERMGTTTGDEQSRGEPCGDCRSRSWCWADRADAAPSQSSERLTYMSIMCGTSTQQRLQPAKARQRAGQRHIRRHNNRAPHRPSRSVLALGRCWRLRCSASSSPPSGVSA